MRALIALTVPTAMVLGGSLLYQASPVTALLLGLGLLLGFALHRSRFCVAAAVQDAVLAEDTGPAKAVLLALALSSVGFGFLQYRAAQAGTILPGNIYAIGPATVIGAVIFGIGIVPAGGCTITTVLRLGEGHLRFAWTLLGLCVGGLLGAWHWGWWMSFGPTLEPVHLPSLLGWTGGAAVQGLLLAGVWLLLNRWEGRANRV